MMYNLFVFYSNNAARKHKKTNVLETATDMYDLKI